MMKKSELVLPEQCVAMSEKEMSQVEGGKKDLQDHIADFLNKILRKKK